MALDCLKIIKYITQMHFLGKLAWVCCAIGSVMRIWPPSSVVICIDYQILPVVRLYIVDCRVYKLVRRTDDKLIDWTSGLVGSDKNHPDKICPWYLNNRNLGALRAWLLAGGPLGLLTLSFVPFGRLGLVTHVVVIGVITSPLDSVLAYTQCVTHMGAFRDGRTENHILGSGEPWKLFFGQSWEFEPPRGAGVWPIPNFFDRNCPKLNLPCNCL